MKNSRKFTSFLLLLALLLTLPVGAFGTWAAEAPGDETEAWLEDLKPENGNLAYGKNVYANWTAAENESWGYAKLTDGSLNPTADGNYGGWHGGDAAVNRRCWAAVDLGEVTSFDTVVLYPTTEGVPNAVRIVVTDDESFFTSAEDPGKIDGMPEGQIVYEACDIEDRSFTPYVCQFEEVSARFVIVYGLSLNAPWLSMKLSEVAVYNKGYTPPEEKHNLALDCVASSNSSHNDSSWDISKINDGDRYNMVLNNSGDHGQFAGYHSGLDTPKDGSADVTITFPLASVSRVSQVVIYPGSTKWTAAVQNGEAEDQIFISSDFAVEVSNDGEIWQEVYAETGYAPTEYAPIVCDFDAVTAGYVRVVFKAVTDHIKLSEIEIYEDGGEAEEDGKLSAGNDLFALYTQTRPGAGDTHEMRIVIVANCDRVIAQNTSFTVRVSFILESGAEVYFTAKLGGSDSDYILYRRVTAGDDEYVAAEGYALFGNVVTGIPNGIYNEVCVTLTDDTTGQVVYSGRS